MYFHFLQEVFNANCFCNVLTVSSLVTRLAFTAASYRVCVVLSLQIQYSEISQSAKGATTN